MIVTNKIKGSFTIIPNSIFRDASVSLKEIGLYCYLLHLPPHYNITYRAIAKYHSDGVESIAHTMKSLIEKDYVTCEDLRTEKGEFKDKIYIVHNESIKNNNNVAENYSPPDTENPDTENPDTVKPHTDKPDSEIRPHISTNNIRTCKNYVDVSCFVAKINPYVSQCERRFIEMQDPDFDKSQLDDATTLLSSALNSIDDPDLIESIISCSVKKAESLWDICFHTFFDSITKRSGIENKEGYMLTIIRRKMRYKT